MSDGIVAMVLRWRTYGGPQIPFAVQKASAALWREETHPLVTREWYRKNFKVAEQILHNRFGYYTPGGGFFLWLDVGDGEEATRRLWREAHVKVLPGAYACREVDGVNSSERYLTLANDRYRLGIDSYLNVITAQTTLLSNQRTAVNLRMQQIIATVQLIKALGVVGLIPIPAIHRNETEAEWIPRPRDSPLRASHHVGNAGLAVKATHERRVR